MKKLTLKQKLKSGVALVQFKVESFKKEAEGVAAIEFAFLAPLMLLMYIGTIEVSSAVSANRKLSRSASAIGDLVTQVDECVDNTTMADIVKIADNIMKPYDNPFQILVVGIDIAADGTNQVAWSTPHNGAAAPPLGSQYTLPTQIANNEGFIVAAKLTMAYTPTFGWANFSNNDISFTNSAINMEEELYLRPRIGGSITGNVASCP